MVCLCQLFSVLRKSTTAWLNHINRIVSHMFSFVQPNWTCSRRKQWLSATKLHNIPEVKDEEWGGDFVDYFEGTVTDKSIFQDSDRKEGCWGQLLAQKGSLQVKGIRWWWSRHQLHQKRPKFDKEMRVEHIRQIQDDLNDLTHLLALRRKEFCKPKQVETTEYVNKLPRKL